MPISTPLELPLDWLFTPPAVGVGAGVGSVVTEAEQLSLFAVDVHVSPFESPDPGDPIDPTLEPEQLVLFAVYVHEPLGPLGCLAATGASAEFQIVTLMAPGAVLTANARTTTV